MKIAVPMTDQLRSKSKEISWGESQQQSFDKLKVALAAAPILDIVDPNEPFVLETRCQWRGHWSGIDARGTPCCI